MSNRRHVLIKNIYILPIMRHKPSMMNRKSFICKSRTRKTVPAKDPSTNISHNEQHSQRITVPKKHCHQEYPSQRKSVPIVRA